MGPDPGWEGDWVSERVDLVVAREVREVRREDGEEPVSELCWPASGEQEQVDHQARKLLRIGSRVRDPELVAVEEPVGVAVLVGRRARRDRRVCDRRDPAPVGSFLVIDFPVPDPVIVVAFGRCTQSAEVRTKSPGTCSIVVSPPVAAALPGSNSSATIATAAANSRFNWNTPSARTETGRQPATWRRTETDRIAVSPRQSPGRTPTGYHPPATVTVPHEQRNRAGHAS